MTRHKFKGFLKKSGTIFNQLHPILDQISNPEDNNHSFMDVFYSKTNDNAFII
ncbi:hypothetical protein HMPREF9442_01072 [Paraprevotella xylaniphila YIT 11841]|uniref:Uncharacterized protein n=1 Tax=Paraprevotella xylaniphila YIT 11841 TaxID=762982 RepID=F3QSB5_9BACT|nr:hypothetical protein HMPREF9442_01072 [Paraprevotella xylaniphila YIT 11841]